ncbi:2OG-Fe(II)-dependent halogenase WelO5 family protein [Martelella alba]|uniref:Fe2OG dioxygenase domain-containing protein n=1 Tax=Martelella alba TaxID=2590451 RepID=A0ABY2SN72_9HYPH|nr:hypothetical protein [Martelella alba]TKI06520.1 hypothetical protein FCN80_09700 [Martelella alba]
MEKLVTEKEFKVSGNTIPSGFGYLETTAKNLDFEIIRSLIQEGSYDGKILYVIRGNVSKEWCESISSEFDEYLSKVGGNREGDTYVSTKQIGASQFSKNGATYTEESRKLAGGVTELLKNVPQSIIEDISLTHYQEEHFLDIGIHFGSARYKNSHANFSTFRRWLDNGSMSLMPHEDKAQTAFACDDNFEIENAKHVIAFNACIQASGEGGELCVWNLEPDESCRRSFGVEKTGYPYPPQHLSGIESFSVRLNPGDVYFLNAGFLHGVQTVRNGQRLTAGRFISAISSRKVIYWT